ncbi:uncharacterized protein A1O5_07652 [Cladophialophora psammophila CBS 110553]|uniref:Uncharacterized protein n=1 Tax=Cladophialophora psammophila CBS 110553 TaxID=1182543 RepID=W9WY76_9EURO|nr:uncharacterized protein A1O5_07652 [Cladophialophora psammophila CBS 110553]EXJ69616.1 hypothetical protein A1O5_07652 [Cladophialophora psammophila CBS 110553]
MASESHEGLSAMSAAATALQGHWRYCEKCSCLHYAGTARCPAGGVHNHSTSSNYSLLSGGGGAGQDDWRWCKKCQVLSYTGGGGGSNGPCSAGGNHDTNGSGNYRLTHNDSSAPGQQNWRWCRKCFGLAYAGGSAGRCQSGGTHDHGGSGHYTLSIDGNPPNGGQDQWRWCSKCQLLAYDGYNACAGGGAHISNPSGLYSVTHNDPNAPGQQGWKWCNKCYVLCHSSPGAGRGVCPKRGTHDYSNSGNYTVLHNVPNPGNDYQSGWRWCSQCHALWYKQNNHARCPQAPNNNHTDQPSGQYWIRHQPA